MSSIPLSRGQRFLLRHLLHIGFSVLAVIALAVACLPPDAMAAQKTVGDITPDFSKAIAEIRAINRDTVGWLQVPGTSVDGVVLQNPPKRGSNNYYLTHDLYKNEDKNGLFCADYRASLNGVSKDELSRITALYGHSWNDDPNGKLFASLKRFRDVDFAKEHPYIFFSTGKDIMAWEIFAVFDTTIQLPYITPKLPDRTFTSMVNIIRELSIYDYNVKVSKNDKILVLSTCTYSVQGRPKLPPYNDYRYVIMARLVSPDDAAKTTASLTVNPDPAAPDDVAAMIKEKKMVLSW